MAFRKLPPPMTIYRGFLYLYDGVNNTVETNNQYTNGKYYQKVSDWHVGDSPWKASKVLQMISKHDLTPKSVYDIGCGAGRVLAELQHHMSKNVEFRGYDISSQAIALSKEKENGQLRFYNEDFLTYLGSSPDLLLLLDVFEHIHDYIRFLELLREKSSLIIFHIPLDICFRDMLSNSEYILNMRSRYGHLHHFTKVTALSTLTDIGYKIIDYFYTDDLEIDSEIPELLRPRLYFECRKLFSRFWQDVASSLFTHFNLMVLAHGDIGKP
jgi:SAM-dependent methyltransferase